MKKPISIIILAAGASTRMGKSKQNLEFEGKSLLRRVAENALESKLCEIVVVLGANAEIIQKEIYHLQLHTVFNTNWQDGMASSIQSGLHKLLEIQTDLEAVLILLCDQPFISVELIKKLAELYQNSSKKIVACEYEDNVGTPALFDKDFFPDLLNLQGQEGAKKIIQKYMAQVQTLSFPLGSFDIDTPKDYQRLKNTSLPAFYS